MTTLQFLKSGVNPVDFKPGINTTCRNGTKWLDVKPGTRVDVVETSSGEKLGEAVIVNCYAKPFEQLTDADIINQHSARTRNKQDLLIAMHAAYADFQSSNLVTMVEFVLAA